MRILSVIYFLFLFSIVCFGQTPESPAVQKKKLDSLFSLIKKAPKNNSIQSDTIYLNTLIVLTLRIEGDTQSYYLNDAIKRCNSYSKLVEAIETKSRSEIEEALKKDSYLYYYLKVKAKLLRIIGGSKWNDEDKLHYFLRSLDICEKAGNKAGMASSYLSICYVYNQQSVFNKATENLLKAQAIYRGLNNKDELANSYFTLGVIADAQHLSDSALKNFNIALNISKQTGNMRHCGIFYEYIGNCYIRIGNYPKAIENHFASLKCSEQLKDIKGVGDSYGDIASIYEKMKDYPKWLDNSVAALQKYKEFANPHLVAAAYRDVGQVNNKLKRTDIAVKYLDSALVIYEKENEIYDMTVTYFLMSGLYESSDPKRTNYLNKAIELSKKHQYIALLKDIYYQLSEDGLKTNDYKTAYKYHVMFTQMKDSLSNFGEETVGNIDEIQAKFDKEKTEQEKLLHEAVVAQKEAKLKQEKTQRYALYGGLILVLVFSVFLFNRFRVTQKQKVIIEEQKQMVDDAFKHLKEKNKEVMDSITYAQRIQKALITSELYIEKQLNRLSKEDK